MKKRLNTRLRQKLLEYERRLNKGGYGLIAGVDEAGRGPLAGPVVASAVILQDHRFRCVINDSKKMSSRSRELAYSEIMEKSVVGIGIVDEKIIDSINIFQATKKAMEMAIANLAISPEYIIVDGRIKLAVGFPVQCIIGGDGKSLSIAAASIIAKVTRDRIMVDYSRTYPQYGFAKHKGYPTFMHRSALKKYGPSPIHRTSFRPVAELLYGSLGSQRSAVHTKPAEICAHAGK